MDITTLKTLVIELRDSGMSFQEISEHLEKNYGIIRSRQALNGLYNRAMESLDGNEEKQRIICDIVNLYSMVENASAVSRSASKLGIDITYRQILGILGDEKTYINSVKATIIAGIVDKLDTASDIRSIRNGINYKGIEISDKRFNEYFEEAYKIYIKQRIEGHLSRIYKLTSDKDMAKRVGRQFNLLVTTDDLKTDI